MKPFPSSEYIQNFNEYIDKHGNKDIEFIPDAINYWMSVDGHNSELKLQSEICAKEIALLEEQLKRLTAILKNALKTLNRYTL